MARGNVTGTRLLTELWETIRRVAFFSMILAIFQLFLCPFISRSSEAAHLGPFLRVLQQYSNLLGHFLQISKCNHVSFMVVQVLVTENDFNTI